PRARSRSKSWLPPQPWMNSTPGTLFEGSRKVPAMCWPSTGIRMVSLSVAMGFYCAVFRNEAGLRVVSLIDQFGVARHLVALSVAFMGIGADDRQLRRLAKRLQCACFGETGDRKSVV